MKNKIILSAFLASAFFALVTISSCTKEETPNPIDNSSNSSAYGSHTRHSRAYHEHFTAVSTITPTATGVYNPGDGEGHTSHIGKANMAFNQLVTIVNGYPVGSTAAPVNQFYSSQLAAAGITVPNTVSSITYDDEGNSVWFTSALGTVLTPVNAHRVDFAASLEIIGGTGKFLGATGQVELVGHFNPQHPNKAAVLESDGNIVY